MATTREHKKPTVPKEAKEAEKIAKHMYMSLTVPEAPRATPTGYIMGTCTVLKMLLEQAVQQGADKDILKRYALKVIEDI